MRIIGVGMVLSIGGSILWLWPTTLDRAWSYRNPWAAIPALVGVAIILFSCYLFGRHLGGLGLAASLIPTIVITVTVYSVTPPERYVGTGGGALALYLFLPAFFLLVCFASAGVGIAIRHRVGKKQATPLPSR